MSCPGWEPPGNKLHSSCPMRMQRSFASRRTIRTMRSSFRIVATARAAGALPRRSPSCGRPAFGGPRCSKRHYHASLFPTWHDISSILVRGLVGRGLLEAGRRRLYRPNDCRCVRAELSIARLVRVKGAVFCSGGRGECAFSVGCWLVVCPPDRFSPAANTA